MHAAAVALDLRGVMTFNDIARADLQKLLPTTAEQSN